MSKISCYNLKQINNKRTLFNLFTDIVLSDPSLHFLYDVVYQQNIKMVIQIHAIQIYLLNGISLNSD